MKDVYVLRRNPDVLKLFETPSDVGAALEELTNDRKFAKRITKLAKTMEVNKDPHIISSEKNNHRDPFFFAYKSENNLTKDEKELMA